MVNLKPETCAHPSEEALADYLSGMLPVGKRKHVEEHLAVCHECLATVVSAHESVRRKEMKMKKINTYLVLAILSFTLSFIIPRFFLQLLVATLLLGIKWVADSKSTKMLIMIHEAWKKDGASGASRILENMDRK